MLLMVKIKEEEKHIDQWYLDSECSSHRTGRKYWFLSISPSMKNKIKFANDNTLVDEGIGDVLVMRKRLQAIIDFKYFIHSK